MKKLTSALALVALATSLVACSKPEEKKPEVKAEAPKVVEETKTTSTSTTTTAPDAASATTASTTTTTTTTLGPRHEVSSLAERSRRPGSPGRFRLVSSPGGDAPAPAPWQPPCDHPTGGTHEDSALRRGP